MRTQEFAPGRPNTIAVLPGRSASRRIVFEAHVDTVSIDGMTIPPFDPRVENGLMYGRGSCDTKAGLAAMMQAAASLKAEGVVPPAEVWIVAAADEEFSGKGAIKLCEDLEADAAVVAEPTSNRLVVAHKGVLRWKIRTHGRAAHSSKPHLGVNAISLMARVIGAIDRSVAELEKRRHPLVGSPTVNAGIIRGGVQVNFVPDSCEIELDRRINPGETPEGVFEEYRAMVEGLGIGATMNAPMLVTQPLETAPDAPLAVAASQVLGSMGLDPEASGVPYGSDASAFSARRIPSILLGPGSIDQAHGAVEWVECAQVEQAMEFYRRLMLAFE